MTTPYTMWCARPQTHDIDVVMDLLHARVSWLRKQGSDQWSTWQRWRPEIEQAIAEHRVWILYETATSTPLGTLTVYDEGDADFWSERERHVPALYLAKLATHPDRAGQDLGRLMLEFAMYLARTKQRTEVRLDVWRTSTQLHRYYQQQGWTHLRTVETPERHSGALFSRTVEQRHQMPPNGLQVRPTTLCDNSDTRGNTSK